MSTPSRYTIEKAAEKKVVHVVLPTYQGEKVHAFSELEDAREFASLVDGSYLTVNVDEFNSLLAVQTKMKTFSFIWNRNSSAGVFLSLQNKAEILSVINEKQPGFFTGTILAKNKDDAKRKLEKLCRRNT